MGEHSSVEMSNDGGRRWFRLRWPSELDEAMAQQLLLTLQTADQPVVEVVLRRGSAEHRVGVRREGSDGLAAALADTVPGLRPEPVERTLPSSLGVWRVARPDTGPLATDRAESTVRTMLSLPTSLLRADEQIVLQWVLLQRLPPSPVVAGTTLGGNGSILLAPFIPPRELNATELRRMQTKRSLPGWRLVGRVGVAAATPKRQRHLLAQLLRALQLAQAPDAQLVIRPTAASNLLAAKAGWLTSGSANVAELISLAALPIGDQPSEALLRQSHRLLPTSKSWPSSGIVLGESMDKRPIRLPLDLARLHAIVTGPTGTGKSEALGHLVAGAMELGIGLCVVDPKNDLVETVLRHVPPHRQEDVVVLDPADPEAVVGVNALAGAAPELVADSLLTMFRQLYGDMLGPRSSDLFYASVLTLARTGGSTLVALPVLLTNASFRRRVLSKLPPDPILQSLWAWFNGLSDGEQLAVVSPLLNKSRPLLYRESLRRVLGDAQPKFDVADVLNKRRILLVSLARGRLGSEGANLLGSLVINQLWRAIERRSSLPPERRSPVLLVVDEFADVMKLPVDIGDALAKSRGFNASWVLATQHWQQLSPAMRASVAANARNRIAFTAPPEDARVLAGLSNGVLSAEDFQRLPKFETYTHLAHHGWASMTTLPPAPSTSSPAAIRAMSRDRYGRPVSEIDQAVAALFDGGEQPPPNLGRRRAA
jgi:hypothetical protein